MKVIIKKQGNSRLKTCSDLIYDNNSNLSAMIMKKYLSIIFCFLSDECTDKNSLANFFFIYL